MKCVQNEGRIWETTQMSEMQEESDFLNKVLVLRVVTDDLIRVSGLGNGWLL
jgi:hypothetical protein